jgi:hypothetical protein
MTAPLLPPGGVQDLFHRRSRARPVRDPEERLCEDLVVFATPATSAESAVLESASSWMDD